MGKKKFIDKKKAAHFHVVRRSQRDPLINDDEASPFVLVPSYIPAQKKSAAQTDKDDEAGEFQDLDEEELNELEKDLDHLNVLPPEMTAHGKKQLAAANQKKSNQNVGEAAKFGILFDDLEYDYTQHLKEMGAPGAIFIPSEAEKKEKSKGFALKGDIKQIPVEELVPKGVLPSEFEEEVGMLNLAAPITGPQPELGEDVLEVLEALEDEAYNEDLGDDFFEELRKEGDQDNDENGDDVQEFDSNFEDDDDDDEEGNRIGDFSEQKPSSGNRMRQDSENSDDFFNHNSDQFETRSRMTNYSMTSSVLARNKGLQVLDERFDKVLEDYEDQEIGELEEDDPRVQGTTTIEKFEDVLDEFIEDHMNLVTYKDVVNEGRQNQTDHTKEKIKATLELFEKEEKKNQIVEEPAKPAWDCETILSTYSNLENHPALIREKPRNKIILGKNGIPVGAFPKPDKSKPTQESEEKENKKEKGNKTKEAQDQAEDKEDDEEDDEEEEGSEDSDGNSMVSVNTGVARSKDETPEEKKERKRAIKEAKKNRRTEKKATKIAFKSEQIRQEKMKMSNPSKKEAIHLS